MKRSQLAATQDFLHIQERSMFHGIDFKIFHWVCYRGCYRDLWCKTTSGLNWSKHAIRALRSRKSPMVKLILSKCSSHLELFLNLPRQIVKEHNFSAFRGKKLRCICSINPAPPVMRILMKFPKKLVCVLMAVSYSTASANEIEITILSKIFVLRLVAPIN